MKRRRGFTLIELLVVIAVIAVLMGILMPALKKAKSLAQGSVCQGNLKGFALGMAMYQQDYNGKFPQPHFIYLKYVIGREDEVKKPVGWPSSDQNNWYRWCNGDLKISDHPEFMSPFARYIGDGKAFICPTFRRLAKNYRGQKDFANTMIGDEITDYDPWYNYSMNAYMGNPTPTKHTVAKVEQVKNSAEKWVIADEGPFITPNYNDWGLNDTYLIPVREGDIDGMIARAGGNIWDVKPGPPPGMGAFVDIIAGFHHAPSGDITGGKGNVVFVDGHVGPVPREETFPRAYPKK